MTESLNVYLNQLENLLETDFGASGADFVEKIASVRSDFPEDIVATLEEIQSGDTADVAGLAFRCGRVTQYLERLRQDRAAESVAVAHADGVAPEILEKTDLDAIARFIAARDRAMRMVADFTLKALLVVVGLLVLGLALGVI